MKENIILKTLELGYEKGLANVSILDIATATDLRKSSLYSHFRSKEEIIQSLVVHCHALLAEKTFLVDFKAKDAQELLVSLVESFIETFAEPPLSHYYAVVQQQRLYDKGFAATAHDLESMITARVKVALEYCVQRSWLDINDTDAAGELFSSAVQNCIAKLAATPEAAIALGCEDTDWELNRLVDSLLMLFGANLNPGFSS